MIVLTALGQAQTLTLWQTWVADLYAAQLAAIQGGTYKVEHLLEGAQEREAVLGTNSKQHTKGNDRRAFVVPTDSKADYKRDVDCYNCGKKGHFARDCRGPKKQRSATDNADDSNDKDKRDKQKRDKEKRDKAKKGKKERRKAALAYLVHDIDSDDETSVSEPVSTKEWWEVGVGEHTQTKQDTGDMESALQEASQSDQDGFHKVTPELDLLTKPLVHFVGTLPLVPLKVPVTLKVQEMARKGSNQTAQSTQIWPKMAKLGVLMVLLRTITSPATTIWMDGNLLGDHPKR